MAINNEHSAKEHSDETPKKNQGKKSNRRKEVKRQRHPFFGGNFDGYYQNISDELTLLFNKEDREHDLQCFYLFTNGNDWHNHRIGDLMTSNDDTGSIDPMDALEAEIFAELNNININTNANLSGQEKYDGDLDLSMNDLIDLKEMYQQLKFYFKTTISFKIDKIMKQINQASTTAVSPKSLLIDLLNIIIPITDIAQCLGANKAPDMINYN